MYYTSKQGGPKAHIHVNSPPQTQGGMWGQLEVVNQSTKVSLRMWLGEDICKLIFRRNWDQLKSTMDKMITDKMTINLNMFSPFMQDIIVSNINGILVIIIKMSSRGCEHT